MSHAVDRIIDVLELEGLIESLGPGAVAKLRRKLMKAHDQTPEIELHPAHSWDCENCGTENFARSVSIHEGPDGEPDEEGIWMTAPDAVICDKCGAKFTVAIEVHEPNEGED